MGGDLERAGFGAGEKGFRWREPLEGGELVLPEGLVSEENGGFIDAHT